MSTSTLDSEAKNASIIDVAGDAALMSLPIQKVDIVVEGAGAGAAIGRASEAGDQASGASASESSSSGGGAGLLRGRKG